MIFPDIKLLDEKDSLLFATTFEEPKLHVSLLDYQGKVLVFEWVEANYPSIGIATFSTIEKYAESINKVGWIIDKDNIRKIKDCIEELIIFKE